MAVKQLSPEAPEATRNDLESYHCIVRNSVGSDFYIGDKQATSADEALEMIQRHIATAERETLKWFRNWYANMTDTEKEELVDHVKDTFALYKNMRAKGYVRPEMYQQLELPAVVAKVFYPGTNTYAHNLSHFVGLEELGFEIG